jgi:hypothetical protein
MAPPDIAPPDIAPDAGAIAGALGDEGAIAGALGEDEGEGAGVCALAAKAVPSSNAAASVNFEVIATLLLWHAPMAGRRHNAEMGQWFVHALPEARNRRKHGHFHKKEVETSCALFRYA